MKILYHLTIPPPKISGSDAVVQDVTALRDRFGGKIVYLNPNARLPVRLPRIGFGFHQLRRLRHLEGQYRLHHIFNPDPFPFPVLRCLQRPIVYSLSGGVGQKRPNLRFFSSLAAITVSDEQSLARLAWWGLDNVHLARPGIDTARFSCTPLAMQPTIRLMAGSAPWSRAQFQSKGVDALLAAAKQCPQLHLVFLWRGVLAAEMTQRVKNMGVESQVEILNKRVDVNRVLAGVHAGIALADEPQIIRPYPHSLIESLAAGKPVIVSRSIAMSNYVEQNGCGQIVEQLDAPHILDAVSALRRSYPALCRAAARAGKQDFGIEQMLTCLGRIYERVQESAEKPPAHLPTAIR